MLGERAAAYDLRGRPGKPFAGGGRDPLLITLDRGPSPDPGGGRFATATSAVILRRATVRRRPALVLLAPPYPRGGLHGGHAIVVWNEGGRGHLVSLHVRDEQDPGRDERDDWIAAALAVARS